MMTLLGLFCANLMFAQAQEMPLGSPLPMADASFHKADGSQGTLSSMLGSNGTVIVFWSNQCVWVDKNQERVLELSKQFAGQGINVLLVNSNDASAFPKEGTADSQKVMQDTGLTYLLDPTSALATAMGASRTPHFFLFDNNRALVYYGSLDDSPGDPANVQKPHLKNAMTALAAGQPISVSATKAFGCTMKFAK